MPSRLRKINIKNELKKKYLINKRYLNDDSLIKNIYLEDDIEDLLKEIEILKKNGYKKINLEIGCGVGDYIKKVSSIFQDSFFIGVDYDIQVIFRAIKNVSNSGIINNVKFFAIDANLLLVNEKIKDKFNKILVPFPDPWPKKRHKKRRFLNEKTIKMLIDLIKNKGVLIIITDNENYANEINSTINDLKSKKIVNIKCVFNDLNILDVNNIGINYTNSREQFEQYFPFVETRYYKKANLKGNKIFYFVLEKIQNK